MEAQEILLLIKVDTGCYLLIAYVTIDGGAVRRVHRFWGLLIGIE
jgi:hypothetical protein